MRFPEPKDFGRAFVHIVLSVLLWYDVVANNNDFGFENAGLYACVTLFPETFLAFVRIRNGSISSEVSQGDSNGTRSELADTPDAEDKPVAKRRKPAGRAGRTGRPY